MELGSKEKKRVGIPRALIYYKFAPLWEGFFRTIGAEIVISPPTSKKIHEAAVKTAPDEDCYSTKLYYGHVMELKDKVDYLFIPRFSSKHKTNIGCPKFIGLAEALRSMYPELPPILMPYYSKAKAGHGRLRFIGLALSTGWIFTHNPFRIFSRKIGHM